MDLRKKIILCSLIFYLGIMPQSSQSEQDTSAEIKRLDNLDGFSDTRWGARYIDVKEKFRTLSSNRQVKEPVEIIYDSYGEEILIRREGIYYRYLFYRKRDPEKKTETDILNRQDVEQKEKETNENARFFFVESSFPMLPAEMLSQKLNLRYGNYTGSSADESNGFYLWDLKNGYLIQWVEAYQNKAYTRNIYYVSKGIREEIMTDLREYQQYRELKALEKIIP